MAMFINPRAWSSHYAYEMQYFLDTLRNFVVVVVVNPWNNPRRYSYRSAAASRTTL